MASKKGRIGDYTRAKLDEIIDDKVDAGGGASGDITAVTAGTGLDGGGTSGDVTLTLNVAEVIASDGANRVLTSDGDGTLTAEANLTYDGTTFTINDNVMVKDDHKFYFGTNSDSYLTYDEATSDDLILSASAFTISSSHVSIRNPDANIATGPQVSFSGAFNAANAYYLSYYDKLYFANFGLWLPDNEKVFLGSLSGGDFEMFHDGTNTNLKNDTGALHISGTNGEVTVSGSHGVNVSGSSIYMESTGDVLVTGSNITLSASNGSGALNFVASTINLGEDDASDTTINLKGGAGDGQLIYDTSIDMLKIKDNIIMEDNKKIIFGYSGNIESYAMFLEASGDSHDFLIISGSADGGLVLSGSQISASCDTGFTVHNPYEGGSAKIQLIADQADDANDVATLTKANNGEFTIATTATSIVLDSSYDIIFDPGTQANEFIIIKSDGTIRASLDTSTAQELRFLDYDDTHVFTLQANAMEMQDNRKLQFGDGADAHIFYDEASADKLIMSGAHGGTYFSGSMATCGALGAAGTTYSPAITTPVTAFDTITDMGTQGSQGDAIAKIADGQGGGDMIRLGTFDSGVVKGHVVNLYRQSWYEADRSDTSANGDSTRWLAVALDDDGGADEGLVLLRGIVRIDAALMNNYADVTDIGDPVYLSTTAGEYDMHPSTTSGDVVRIVGYLIDTDGTDFLIYFNPDNTFVTLA